MLKGEVFTAGLLLPEVMQVCVWSIVPCCLLPHSCSVVAFLPFIDVNVLCVYTLLHIID